MSISTSRVQLSQTMSVIAVGPGSVAVVLQSFHSALLEINSSENAVDDDNVLVLSSTGTRDLAIELDAGDRIHGKSIGTNPAIVTVVKKS